MPEFEFKTPKLPNMAKLLADRKAMRLIAKAAEIDSDAASAHEEKREFLQLKADAHRIVARRMMNWGLTPDQYLILTTRIEVDESGGLTYRDCDD